MFQYDLTFDIVYSVYSIFDIANLTKIVRNKHDKLIRQLDILYHNLIFFFIIIGHTCHN